MSRADLRTVPEDYTPHPSEYDANGHYAEGPLLKQPSLWKMIAEAHGRLVREDAASEPAKRMKNFRAKITLAMQERRSRIRARKRAA